MDVQVKLSKAGKMPCKSWSLQARVTCPGSFDSSGTLVQVCEACYATQGMYNMPSVKNVRIYNQQDWKRDDWVDEMVYSIEKDDYFRWFDSGDCYSKLLALKILLVMRRTPNTKHWLPTRSYKFQKFQRVFDLMNSLPNVVVRFSGDSIGHIPEGSYSSTTALDSVTPIDGAQMCVAYDHEGNKCLDCRACWSKDVQTISYPIHGRKYIKLLKEEVA